MQISAHIRTNFAFDVRKRDTFKQHVNQRSEGNQYTVLIRVTNYVQETTMLEVEWTPFLLSHPPVGDGILFFPGFMYTIIILHIFFFFP